MSLMTEKSPKEFLWENSVKIIEIKPTFCSLTVLCFYDVYNDISVRILLISKLNIPFKSSHKDESFNNKIITLRQCVNQL